MGPENKQLDRITRWYDSSCHLFHGKEKEWFSNTFSMQLEQMWENSSANRVKNTS